ncbi:hypothetical protein CkaCkLH20_06472 [Colletotrichum karsti]|uniref:Uncharacterized protein n=1 Tax=Colletotrichum karsti TaxID=1095194 RepID=A0A9P6I6L0_9PEZI|nr:uncharacterized protein CkaCkLH20_06472 [Colletotrichum karsti]KAF9876026.1 hypothetical protein CkaCkLH20_06472 [Colletotrichum karsti]
MSSAPVSSRPGTGSVVQPPTTDERFGGPLLNHLPFTSKPNDSSSSSSRPSRPLSQHFNFPPSFLHGRRASLVQGGDLPSPTLVEDSRESVSSNGSWMRRLSLRPLSQHGSIRSSLGLDSQSVALSNGSAAPILSPTGSTPPTLPPNKLVKRPPSAHQNGPVGRLRSRTHLPSLRRPATSHQRSATLHKIHHDVHTVEPTADPKFSFDQYKFPNAEGAAPPPPKEGNKQEQESQQQLQPQSQQQQNPKTKWTSFFHSRRANVIARSAPDRLIDRSPSTRSSTTTKRIFAPSGEQNIYLIQGGMLGDATSSDQTPVPEDIIKTIEDSQDEAVVEKEDDDKENDDRPATPEDTPTKRTQRSFSMHFTSPNWMPRAGSIRRSKRGESKTGNKRNASAPATESPGQGHARDDLAPSPAPASSDYSPTTQKNQPPANLDPASALQQRRNTSSPLPPLSRLSSFNVDVSRVGSTGSGPSPRSIQPSGSSQSSAAMAAYYRGPQTDRSSTLNSSDIEARDFMSGDDDDTDFKSDTMFDSLRTAASAINRLETPTESMFDESPPGTAIATKTKRLSIQEILGRSWDADDRIMEEEDESIPTPVRVNHEPRIRPDSDVSAPRYSIERPSNEYSIGSKDFGRLSIEDDFDDDWARDEDEMAYSNQLSPPSSMNSRGVSPNLRIALANISGNRNTDATHDPSERPRSNIFDWSEPTSDKPDSLSTFRPKTAYGKELDIRGGRAAVRKGPTAMHVRSQSVPVVHDIADNASMTSQKFGTWGLGTKNVSEDWDDDFEFGGNEAEDKEAEVDFAMVVPASIQASQPSLKQHTGHIRELSLLVNDLKRLCRHGRDLDMLGGSSAGLWQEAEGIIALASPDEDELEGMDVDSSSVMSDRFMDGFDAASPAPIEKEDPFDEVKEINVSRTAVIRERPAGRRRSVFSPDDDIFGGNSPAPDELPPPRPKTPENNINMGGHDVTDIVRSVLDAMQQRTAQESARDDKLHFGTNSLKALVKRAGDLRDILSEVVRRADQLTSSPARTPRPHNDSPAFTRVFTPEHTPSPSSPPKKLPQTRSANSVLTRGSVDASPSSGLQRMHMMTVS